MARRASLRIPDEMLDRLLSGADASTAFDQDGLLDQLKKALAERALNAEMDHHVAGEGGAGNSRNGYGRKSVITDTGRIGLEVPRSHARTMLVEAAWSAVRGPGPLRAFYQRVASRRGKHIAAVAVARKMAVIIWHMLHKGEDYAAVRPALHAKKLRNVELRAGRPARRGQRGPAYAYNLARTRREEMHRAEQAETAYRRQTENWTRRGRSTSRGSSAPSTSG